MAKTVAVVGLGYVGLPLALAFGRVLPTIGFDVSAEKLEAYQQAYDPTGEMDKTLFVQAKQLRYTYQVDDLKQADFVVVAVLTPVDVAHQPDLTLVKQATAMVGKHLKQGAIVIW